MHAQVFGAAGAVGGMQVGGGELAMRMSPLCSAESAFGLSLSNKNEIANEGVGLRAAAARRAGRGIDVGSVSYNVVRDGNGNVKLDSPIIGKQLAADEISAQMNLEKTTVRVEDKRLASLQAIASSSGSDSPAAQLPAVMVNCVTGKMGRATAEAVVAAGLQLVPVSLVGRIESADDIDIMGVKVTPCHISGREAVLDKVVTEVHNMIIVDYTVPQAVNDNAEFYCRRGLPFVMGTTGGDREKLMNDVLKSGVYAVIAPQMGKQVVAFQAAIQVMAEQFPGAYSGYKLEVTESHQSSKLDTSGTAKAVVESFTKLGLNFDVNKIEKVRDAQLQKEKMKVPEEHLLGHAFHTYSLVSPDDTVSFQFQHNVCGRSIYAEGTVDAVLFLAKKIKEKADKKVYNMIDVLREGNMR